VITKKAQYVMVRRGHLQNEEDVGEVPVVVSNLNLNPMTRRIAW
jgi:hypothetical protein